MNKSKYITTTMFIIVVSFVFAGFVLPLIAQEQSSAPLEVPPGLSEIKVIHQEAAQYPPLAKKYFYKGVVGVEVVIAKDGSVKDASPTDISMDIDEKLKKEVEKTLKTKKKNEDEDDQISQMAREEKIELAMKDAAVAAAMKWKFKPIKAQGKAVSIKYPLKFNFKMNFQKTSDKKNAEKNEKTKNTNKTADNEVNQNL